MYIGFLTAIITTLKQIMWLTKKTTPHNKSGTNLHLLGLVNIFLWRPPRNTSFQFNQRTVWIEFSGWCMVVSYCFSRSRWLIRYGEKAYAVPDKQPFLLSYLNSVENCSIDIVFSASDLGKMSWTLSSLLPDPEQKHK